MAHVAVLTDSSAYLPGEVADELGITAVSQYYDLGRGLVAEPPYAGDYRSFYADLAASDGIAESAPVPVEDFTAAYGQLLDEHDSVVSINLSSGLSDTCSNAREAAGAFNLEDGSERVMVIDSAGACGHLGCQVIAAARAAAAGADAEQVVARAHEARQQVRLWFLVDTLEYLRRGGRIGSAAAWIGSALDIKPILSVESEIRAVERVRTRRRGVDRLVELMRQHRALGADRWFVQHTQAIEDATGLVGRLREIFTVEPEFVSEIGPAVGTHIGPGALIVGGVSSEALGR